jgi:hypothetical protein
MSSAFGNKSALRKSLLSAGLVGVSFWAATWIGTTLVAQGPPAYAWTLPSGFPPPPVAPYMHDGSVATLDDAIAHYAAGGRTIQGGPHRGVGHDNPNKTDTIRGFTITADQRVDLVSFLRSLTDEDLLRDPRFANPWPYRSSRLQRQ